VAEKDDFFEEEASRISVALEISITAQAQRTAITLKEFVDLQRLAGLSNTQIENILFDDLINSGRIFGEFKRSLGITSIGKMNELANIAEYAEQTDGNSEERLRWLTVEDERVCPDCAPRHGQVESFSTWVEIGLPKSGWSVCRHFCRCKLVNADGTEIIDKPIKRVRGE
jgi:hypothetical protein